jgi:RNA polymerase sigma-70 factor (ECF subfamily)
MKLERDEIMPDWDAIVAEHGRLVWRTAFRLLGNHADASDCFQETFVSALSASRRQQVENWGGFLQRLATTQALDRLRHRFRQAGRDGHLANDAIIPCPNLGPLVQADFHELNSKVRRALADLPPNQAEVICLHYLEEWSYQEIGRHKQIAINAVGSLLHRARARLRETLARVASEQES